MILYINSENEIKDVNETSDENLTAIEISDESNPFAGWSVAKICCHKISLNEDGQYDGFTPYVDSRIIEHIERLGLGNEKTDAKTNMVSEETAMLSETLDVLISDIIPSLTEGLME